MRILHTENSCGWGGQELRILSEAQGLQARGHDVSLVCPLQSRIFAEARQMGLAAEALPIMRKSLKGLRALQSYLAQHPVDVVNCHSSTDSWLAALACLGMPHPPALVRTRHISAAVPINPATRWLYRRAACIVTTGEALRLDLMARLALDPARIVSIPTGIDTVRFAPPTQMLRQQIRRQMGLADATFALLIVATLRSWKGHADLLAALSTLPSHREWQLYIVGDGPQREALQAQTRQLGLTSKVHFEGHQSDVVPWLHASDAFLLPSYANEGVPQALMQAMLCGIACITTNVGGIPEIARHEQTALIVPPRDVSALAAAIERMHQEPLMRSRLGQSARVWVAQQYGREAMLDAMETVFAQAIKAKRSSDAVQVVAG